MWTSTYNNEVSRNLELILGVGCKLQQCQHFHSSNISLSWLRSLDPRRLKQSGLDNCAGYLLRISPRWFSWNSLSILLSVLMTSPPIWACGRPIHSSRSPSSHRDLGIFVDSVSFSRKWKGGRNYCWRMLSMVESITESLVWPESMYLKSRWKRSSFVASCSGVFEEGQNTAILFQTSSQSFGGSWEGGDVGIDKKRRKWLFTCAPLRSFCLA